MKTGLEIESTLGWLEKGEQPVKQEVSAAAAIIFIAAV